MNAVHHPRPSGEQLTDALRDAYAANGSDTTSFPAFAVGYLEGLLNDIAAQSPAARDLIQHHIDSQRARSMKAAA